MNAEDKKHSEVLREALLALDHSGPNGFEGLLSIVLGAVTGQSFRLAKSGTQRGRDGDSAFDGGATYFEGKRYRESPKSAEIAAKLLDLMKDDVGQVDLWVLGATCEVAAQTASDLRTVCERSGIGGVLLDWSSTDLGALLVAIAAAGKKAADFIRDKLAGKSKAHLINGTLIAIDHFAEHPDFPARLESLRRALTLEDAGLGHARIRNREWLTATLSSRISARAAFGQPLAPRDASGLVGIARPLEASLANAFTGCPTAGIYAIIGDEGVGKSWLAASTWLASNPASILLLCPAEDLLAHETTWDFDTFLIGRLIKQTGGRRSDRAEERWRRRIAGWRANPTPKNVRVTIVFDGLNQPLKANWSKLLDHVAAELTQLGGCLVITTRSTHWSNLKNALISKIIEIPVVEWTESEVSGILQSRGIDPGKVTPDVLQSLRNPRILGIAIDLLTANDVETIEQISVGRLMFEHLRKAQTLAAVPMSGPEFAELLKALANETLLRAQQQQTDDLLLFDARSHHHLKDVASCRFFVPVKGRLQYEIKQDGLDLGLALSIIDALEKERRNKRDPRDRLSTILEPVSALDETARVVFLATQIACLDEDASPEVRSALIEHFVELQNLPNAEADAFAVLARSAAPAFLIAAENVHTAKAYTPNADWLLYALLSHRDDPRVWTAISDGVRRWLAFYSLAPERMMFRSTGRDAEDEVIKERKKCQAALDQKINELTDLEKNYRDSNLFHTNRWHLNSLHQLAFYLLAGKPLESFANDLVKWGFSDALGPAIHAPDKEFRQLIRFNRVDWKETRVKLIESIKAFDATQSSSVGKWATVEILRATGAIEDAEGANTLAEWLTRDREKFAGWSLVQDYCENDPCDPGTEEPDNVRATAVRYRAIDVSKIATRMGNGPEDSFLNMARAGVARFHLDDALITHRALADDFLTRVGFARRQGALLLLEHSAALTAEQALAILKAGQDSTVKIREQKNLTDEWLTAQNSIFIAIGHLSGDEQLEEIANIEGDTLLLSILEALRPASTEVTERVLERLLASANTDQQSCVLAAIRYSKPPLSPRSLSIIGEFLRSTNEAVHAQALGAAAASGDRGLIELVVMDGWDARSLRGGKQVFERWYGSSAILEAAKIGLISLDEALDRMDLNHYGFAASALGRNAAKAIAARVDAALIKSIGYTQTANLPEMATSTPHEASPAPPLMSLNDPPGRKNAKEIFERSGETNEQFAARQDRMAEVFERFTNELTSADANLVLSDLTLGGIKALVGADEEAGKRWLEMLSSASDARLSDLHHVALQLAVALPTEGGSKTLLSRIANVRPRISRSHGFAKVPADSLALWRNADIDQLRDICERRLVNRRNDAEIALEVLAAILSGNAAIVENEIEKLLATAQPADTCLAITLAGFCDESRLASDVLTRFDGAHGYIGIAHRAAHDAYQRNLWARSWFKQMTAAKEPVEFWQASVLFTKIVDARFDIWAATFGPKTDTCQAFLPSVLSAIGGRIEKWQKTREDHLFGDKSPADFFLSN